MTVGIDLGSQHLSAAWVGPAGSPQLVADKHDPEVFVTPTSVGAEGSRLLVGRSAEVLAEDSPNAPIARRLKLSIGNGESALRDGRGRAWHAETALVPVLQKVLDDATLAAGNRPAHGVLTVPREFTPAQRQAVLRAADWAGLSGVVLLDRSLAATRYLAGSVDASGTPLALVLAMGNRFAEASVIELGPQSLAVRSCASARLGAAVFDEAVLHALRPLLGDAIDDPITRGPALQAVNRLRQKFAKPGASEAESVLFVRGKPFLVHLLAAMHQQAIAPSLDQVDALVEDALQQAGVTWQRLGPIWPVGGGAQEASVLARLSAKAGRAVTARQSLQAAAFGAAQHAHDLHQGTPWMGLPARPGASGAALALRLVDAEKKVRLDPLIAAGAPRPSQAVRRFTTARDDQTRMVFDLVFAQGTTVESAGLFAFGPIPKPRAGLGIELQVSVSPQGVLHADAIDTSTSNRLPRTLLTRGVSSEPLVAQRTLLEGLRYA